MKDKNCYECKNLPNCRLRDIILNPDIKKCNYAKEGCIYYKGDGLSGSAKDKLLTLLKTNDGVTMQLIHEKTGLEIYDTDKRQVIWNAINRLIKDGHNIKKINGKKGFERVIFTLT